MSAVNGIVLIDKPLGLTSNAVLQRVKRLFHADKAGHTGTLDPLATGMLPICLGEATKFSQFALDADKAYQVTGLLGIKTNTADKEGQVVATVEQFELSLEQLEEALCLFRGTQTQIPSMYSALKYQGKSLYHYARQGITVNRPARTITIHTLNLLDFDGRSFSLFVRCSKGTYIRNLVEDIGEHLGLGAHVTQLRRTDSAGLETLPMVTLERLEQTVYAERQSFLLPVDKLIEHLPCCRLSSDEAHRLQQGQVLKKTQGPSQQGLVRLYQGNNFIGLGEACPFFLKAKRLIKPN